MSWLKSIFTWLSPISRTMPAIGRPSEVCIISWAPTFTMSINISFFMTYVLRENDENGPILQETTKENPFVCIFGMHQLLPKFEENLMGKEPGDHYAFHLTPEEGYGERDEAYVMDLDKNMFMKNDMLMDMVKVGAQLMMQTDRKSVV